MEKDYRVVGESGHTIGGKRADVRTPDITGSEPSGKEWMAALLAPLCCVMPLLLLAFASWVASASFQFSWSLGLAAAVGLLAAGLIYWGIRSRRSAGTPDAGSSRKTG
jgi:cytosine/uracil/thiamine/allantoin permease